MQDSTLNNLQFTKHKLTRLDDEFLAGRRMLAFLDACDDRPAQQKIAELGDRAVSLYRGPAARELATVAPYVLEVDAAFLEWLLQSGIDRPWGYFLDAGLDVHLADIRRHFRRYLIVNGPSNKEFYFRFYDPRVVPSVLRSMSSANVVAFFGPVEAIYLVNEDSDVLEIRPAPTADSAVLPKRLAFGDGDLQSIAIHRRAEFRHRLVTHLRLLLEADGNTAGSRGLESRVTAAINRAGRYQLSRQVDIARYAEIVCLQLPESSPEQDPLAVRNILHDKRVNIRTRLDRLEAWAHEQKNHSSSTESLL